MDNSDRPAGRSAGHRAMPIAHERLGGGLIRRTIRALSLDSDLYREVSAPGASTLQAVLIVMLAAVGVGLGEGSRTLLFMLGAWQIESRTGLLWYTFVDKTLPIAALHAAVHLAAWPVWAAALWIIGGRLVAAGGRTPRFGSVARGLAFAQAPGLLLILTPVLVRALVPIIGFATDPETDPGRWGFVAFQLPRTLDFGFRTLISGWVLIGTFLSLRESLGLSNGRTLGAMLAAGIAVAVLLGILAKAIAFAVPSPPWTFNLALSGDSFLGIGGSGPLAIFWIENALPISLGFDFNLGLIDGFMRVFARGS